MHKRLICAPVILALIKALLSLLGFKGLVLITNVRLTVYSQTSINNTQSNVDSHTQSKQAIIRTIHQTVVKQI